MRLSGWNRHFKKTDPSIHRETIKLIARHHATNWRCSVPLCAMPRRAMISLSLSLSARKRNSFPWNVNDKHRYPVKFPFQRTATYLIVSSVLIAFEKRRTHSMLFQFHCFRAKEIKSACSCALEFTLTEYCRIAIGRGISN